MSHYFNARLMQQFDAVIHFDKTRALEALELGAGWMTEEAQKPTRAASDPANSSLQSNRLSIIDRRAFASKADDGAIK